MNDLKSKYEEFEKIESVELKEAFSHLENYRDLLTFEQLKRDVNQPKPFLDDLNNTVITNLEKTLKTSKNIFENLKHDKSIFHLLKKRIKRILKDVDDYFNEFSDNGKKVFLENMEKIQKWDREIEDELKDLINDTRKILKHIEFCIKELEHTKRAKKRINERVGSLIKKPYEKLIAELDECISKIPKIEKRLHEDYEFLKETHKIMMS